MTIFSFLFFFLLEKKTLEKKKKKKKKKVGGGGGIGLISRHNECNKMYTHQKLQNVQTECY